MTVSVHPDPAQPGRNVRVLALLLIHLNACHPYNQQLPIGWDGADLSLRPVQIRGAPFLLRIIDWAPESEPWGGHSDNMIRIRVQDGQPVVRVAKWIVSFLHVNGHFGARYERVKLDGSVDVYCDTLFVSCKINVLPA